MAFSTPAIILGTGQRDANGTGTVTLTGSQTVGLNDLITVKVSGNVISSLDAGWSATDNLSNTWQLDKSQVSGTSDQVAILSTRSAAGTLTLITLTPTNSIGRVIAVAEQTTGVKASGTYVDQTAGAAGTGTAASSGATAALAGSGELGMAATSMAAGATASSCGGSYTLQATNVSTNGTTDKRLQGSYEHLYRRSDHDRHAR
jgi:hypothetical protein